MTSEKDAPPPSTPPADRPKLIRFDFPPGATPEDIAKGIRELVERNKPPER